MQGLIPLCSMDILLFKTSTSFIDHLQEFLGAILTCTLLVIPPFNEFKANPICLVNLLKVFNLMDCMYYKIINNYHKSGSTEVTCLRLLPIWGIEGDNISRPCSCILRGFSHDSYPGQPGCKGATLLGCQYIPLIMISNMDHIVVHLLFYCLSLFYMFSC